MTRRLLFLMVLAATVALPADEAVFAVGEKKQRGFL